LKLNLFTDLPAQPLPEEHFNALFTQHIAPTVQATPLVCWYD
jgi:hypothetical protein